VTGAALALALALLVSPAPSRHRILARRHQGAPHPRTAVVPSIAALALAIAVVAPAGVAVATVAIGATALVRRRGAMRERRRTDEAVALQGALDVLVGELRVGAHPVAACGVAADEARGTVAESLRTVAARARMGADVATAMRDVARRSALPVHWESLAVCWELAESHGLAIASLMKTAQRDIVERERFAGRVAAGMAGARTTGAVLAGLPVIGIALGQLIGADPLEFLLRGGAGDWLLTIGVALACTGLLWSDRITAGVMR
jgi:tight adherence protein B